VSVALRPREWMGGALALAVAFAVLAEGPESHAPVRPGDAPELPLSLPPCGVAPALAPGRVAALEAVATSRAARLPFDLRDGVEAHDLLAEAVACSKLADDRAAETQLASELTALTGRLVHAYRERRLALRIALVRGDTRRAVAEMHALAGPFAGVVHPWVAWLERRRRELEGEGASE
jgi:hypothetical protein